MAVAVVDRSLLPSSQAKAAAIGIRSLEWQSQCLEEAAVATAVRGVANRTCPCQGHQSPSMELAVAAEDNHRIG